MLKIRVVPGYEGIEQAIETVDRLLKDDVTSRVWLSHFKGQKVVVKRINDTGFKTRLRRCFRKSRPAANWDNAARLRAIGIPTFSPLAVIEERWYGLNWGKSYLICSYVEGISALDCFTQKAFLPEWSDWIHEIVQLMLQLRKNKISHRDLNPSNLIFSQGKWHLIDLDAMRVHCFDWTAQRYFKRECARFLENWQDTKGTNPQFLAALWKALI